MASFFKYFFVLTIHDIQKCSFVKADVALYLTYQVHSQEHKIIFPGITGITKFGNVFPKTV